MELMVEGREQLLDKWQLTFQITLVSILTAYFFLNNSKFCPFVFLSVNHFDVTTSYSSVDRAAWLGKVT
jgi:hypothetical protein